MFWGPILFCSFDSLNAETLVWTYRVLLRRENENWQEKWIFAFFFFRLCFFNYHDSNWFFLKNKISATFFPFLSNATQASVKSQLTVGGKMAMLWIITKILKNSIFCLLSISKLKTHEIFNPYSTNVLLT